MAYVPIPDSDIDPESPGTATLFTRLRDNPIRIAEGAAGAPRIEYPAFDDDVKPWRILDSADITTAVATVNFPSVFTADYDIYRVEIEYIQLATVNQYVYIRTTDDNGAIYRSGSTDYQVSGTITTASGSLSSDSDDGATTSFIRASSAITNALLTAPRIDIEFFEPAVNNGRYKNMVCRTFPGNGGNLSTWGGARRATNALTGFRLYSSSGNITSAKIRIYGRKY